MSDFAINASTPIIRRIVPSSTAKEEVCEAETSLGEADNNLLSVFHAILVADIGIGDYNAMVKAGYANSIPNSGAAAIDIDTHDLNENGVVDGAEEWSVNYLYAPFFTRIETAFSAAFQPQFSAIKGGLDFASMTLEQKALLAEKIAALLQKSTNKDFCSRPYYDYISAELALGGAWAHDDEKLPLHGAAVEQNNPDSVLSIKIDGLPALSVERFSLLVDANVELRQNFSDGRSFTGSVGLTPTFLLTSGDWPAVSLGLSPAYALEYADLEIKNAGILAPSRNGWTVSLGLPVTVDVWRDGNVTLELEGRWGVNRRDYYAKNYDGLGFSERTQTWSGAADLHADLPELLPGISGLPVVDTSVSYSDGETALPSSYLWRGKTITNYESTRVRDYGTRTALSWEIDGWQISPYFTHRRIELDGQPPEYTDNRGGGRVMTPWFGGTFGVDVASGSLSNPANTARGYVGGQLIVDFMPLLREVFPYDPLAEQKKKSIAGE